VKDIYLTQNFRLHTHLDADYADDLETRRSIKGNT
jgi:hypothetical protein